MTVDPNVIERITKELVDRGKIIEAGWQGLRLLSIPADAPAIQLTEMRQAFFAGAQHLFASIVTMLEAGTEPTDVDLSRMTAIDVELREFLKDFKLRYGEPGGSA